MFFQERVTVGGVLAPAVNNPHAAIGLPQAVPDEFLELIASIENAQPMQIQMRLNRKAPGSEGFEPTLPAWIGRAFHILSTNHNVYRNPTVNEVDEEL